jgi:inner membrane protein
MDNLTHSLVGLLLSRAGFRKLHPHATPLLVLAANSPDVDVISLAGGAGTYFQYHRGITHALVSVPVVALLPVAIVALIWRKERIRWLPAWLIAIAGIASHLLLDWTNPYGIRLFLPWSSEWPGLFITSVIDPWIWGTLLFAALMPLLGRLVSSEIGGKSGSGAGLAIFGLLLIGAYDTTRYFLQHRATVVLDGQIYDGESPRRVTAYPDMLNPMLWHGIVETDTRFVSVLIHLTDERGQNETRVAFKPESSPAIQAAATEPQFVQLREFSRAMLWTTTPAPGVEGNSEVIARDLFFEFTARAIVDKSNHVLSSEFHF